MITEIEHCLYGCEQIRQIEQNAKKILHIDSYELMERAGAEAFDILMKKYSVRDVAIFCGSGNNAGDGYVLARLLWEAGLTVTVYPVKLPQDLPEPARFAASLAIEAGVPHQDIDEPLDFGAELIVDALSGIGMHGAPTGIISTAIHQINDSGLPVVSLDLPSGLNADTGKVEGICVKADLTITFIAPKTGLYTMDGPDYCGQIYCASLQLEPLLKITLPKAWLLQTNPFPLPARKKNSHKGNYGQVLIIGGGAGMAGAAALAARSCFRTGAGLVSIATTSNHANGAFTALLPEAIVHGINKPDDLKPLLEKATVCVLGPGLGDSAWAEALCSLAITSRLPMVVDASALRWLATCRQQDDNWVLTPHPGEAAALLDTTTEAVLKNRYAAISSLQELYGGVIVLKGCGTLIKTLDGKISLCNQGNPGMATAGMGDVLSGIIAGLIAQGHSLSDAATLGVYAHAFAADRWAARFGERGLLAGDIADYLPSILNGKVL